MKKIYKALLSLVTIVDILTFANTASHAQAFQKKSFVSISEGHTLADYSTKSDGDSKSKIIMGDRDPLIIEYGLSDHWGIGLSSGLDFFTINPSDFYGFNVSDNSIKSFSNEFTIDGNFHVFTNSRLDLSVFLSLGGFSVNFNETEGDYSYHYKANGNIIRTGSRVRYYFWKHLGAFGMISSYAASAGTKNVTDNTVGRNTTTAINGYTVEMGLCYRFAFFKKQ